MQPNDNDLHREHLLAEAQKWCADCEEEIRLHAKPTDVDQPVARLSWLKSAVPDVGRFVDHFLEGISQVTPPKSHVGLLRARLWLAVMLYRLVSDPWWITHSAPEFDRWRIRRRHEYGGDVFCEVAEYVESKWQDCERFFAPKALQKLPQATDPTSQHARIVLKKSYRWRAAELIDRNVSEREKREHCDVAELNRKPYAAQDSTADPKAEIALLIAYRGDLLRVGRFGDWTAGLPPLFERLDEIKTRTARFVERRVVAVAAESELAIPVFDDGVRPVGSVRAAVPLDVYKIIASERFVELTVSALKEEAAREPKDQRLTEGNGWASVRRIVAAVNREILRRSAVGTNGRASGGAIQ